MTILRTGRFFSLPNSTDDMLFLQNSAAVIRMAVFGLAPSNEKDQTEVMHYSSVDLIRVLL